MNSRQRKHLKTLQRRRSRLAEILDDYRADGDSEPTRREMAALDFAITIISNADREPEMLTDLERME